MPPREQRQSQSRPPFQLTPEQLALQAARRELKARKAAEGTNSQSNTARAGIPDNILLRDWLQIQPPSLPDDGSVPVVQVSIMTWNMLAQSLVRRELFPGSDALKFGTRGPMLPAEIIAYSADIICLQEVDRLDELLPAVQKVGYKHVYASGRKKEHGCMLLFKDDSFELLAEKTVYYDEEDVHDRSDSGSAENSQSTQWWKGTSRLTKNIGLIVALRHKDNEQVFVVATTHLFWHPAYVYERSKQTGILLRSIAKFRNEHEFRRSLCLLAGDFNLTPDDVTYSLLVGEEVTLDQTKALNKSRVVHVSIDPSIPKDLELKPHEKSEEDESEGVAGQQEEGETDPDRIITNSRLCEASDGLLDYDGLVSLYRQSGLIPLQSIYDTAVSRLVDTPIETLQQRVPFMKNRKGANEPKWTSYTHFWKTTLDYIFVAKPTELEMDIEAILRPHRTDDMGSGLPKQQVCGSDHISLVAKLSFRKMNVE